MADLEHVQPGDLITSQLINDIIDALRNLDAKIDKCCEEIKPTPTPGKLFIGSIDPKEAAFDQLVDIIGGGFIPDEKGNVVVIGDQPVVKFGKITTSVIQAVVPRLDLEKSTKVSVIVANANGKVGASLMVGPRTPDVVFVPTPPEVVEMMLKMAEVTKTDVVFDLGSGDGRVVIMAAERFGAGGVGIDIDPVRIKEARALAKKAKVTDRVAFIEGDLFTEDLSKATVIALHLLPDLNRRLRPQLEKLKPGTRIISHAFDMGDWVPDKQERVKGPDKLHDVYLWIIP